MWLWDDFNNAEFVTWFSQLFYKSELIDCVELFFYIQHAQNEDDFCEKIFSVTELINSHCSVDFFSKWVILCILNTEIYEFNNLLQNQMSEKAENYFSVNIVNTDDVEADHEKFSWEFLQSINLSELSSSFLQFKIDMLIMLFHNFQLLKELCNETQLIITCLTQHLIETCILTDEWKNMFHILSCIDLHFTLNELLFILTCQQFLIRICFTMIINKTQDQSLNTVDIDLQIAVFSHDQFYVVHLWIINVINLIMLLLFNSNDYTQNVVFSEMLNELN